MTTIAAFASEKHIAVAADGRTTSTSGFISLNVVDKLLRLGDDVFGIAGVSSLCDRLMMFIAERGDSKIRSKEDLVVFFRDVQSHFGVDFDKMLVCNEEFDFPLLLVATPAGIFTISGGAYIQEFDTMAAVGSGAHHALGAMTYAVDCTTAPGAEATARAAVSIAAKHDTGTGAVSSVHVIGRA